MGKKNGTVPFEKVNGSGYFKMPDTGRDGYSRFFRKEGNGLVSEFVFWGDAKFFSVTRVGTDRMRQFDRCIPLKKKKAERLCKQSKKEYDYRDD